MKNKAVLLVIIALILAVSILVFLNIKSGKLDTEQAQSGTMLVTINENQTSLDMEAIKNLKQHTFNAIQDTSKSGPQKQTYKGVLLRDILQYADPQLLQGNFQKVIIRGIDGYTAALSFEEVLQEDNAYIATQRNDKPLGNKKSGGTGPYQLIIRQDQFSQRWCKYVSEVTVQ